MIKTLRVIIAIFTLLVSGGSASFAASNQDRPTHRMSDDERLFEAKLDAIRARLDGASEALRLKTAEMDRRLDGLNELRAEVIRDRDQFVRKDVYDYKIKIIDDLINRVTIIETRLLVWISALGVFFVFLQVVTHFFITSRRQGTSANKFSDVDLARVRDAWMKTKE